MIFTSKISFIQSSECVSTKNLNIGFLKNEYIEYEPYLYYELGKFASKTGTSYNLELFENNNDNFDIIFGEYYDLRKFQNRNLVLNDEILNFYKKNNIEIFGNILPLDLDTFVILSKDNQESLTFDDLSNFFSPIQYTLGINLIPKEQFIKLITYNLKGALIQNNDINLEYLLSLYTNTYENINKNIIGSNFLELVESYANYENTFTVFSDGVLLNKSMDYEYFQLFPQTKYSWSDDEGFFKKPTTESPISFFGFSAYINNEDALAFICHLIDKQTRTNTFTNFNLQISPLSEIEIENALINNIPQGYRDILINKNKNIFEIDNYLIENYEKFLKIISKKTEIIEFMNTDNYLN